MIELSRGKIMLEEVSIALMNMGELDNSTFVLGIEISREELSLAKTYAESYVLAGGFGFGELPEPTGSIKELLSVCLAA